MDNIKNLLDIKFEQYNNPEFIESDPICIPHMYSSKEDIEISAFLTSIIAWGRRTAIIQKGLHLMELMDNSPSDFINNSKDADMKRFERYVYRTMNPDDCIFLIESLKNIYRNHGGLEKVFTDAFQEHDNIYNSIIHMRSLMVSIPHLKRSEKHLANPASGSAAKRLNMFLRWMIRNDKRGVDFGIWDKITPSKLMCPLDVHSGNVARRLGLLKIKQNDWRSVEELTNQLIRFDCDDPVKYDFALFGLGVFEGVN